MPAGGVEELIGVVQERWQASPTVGCKGGVLQRAQVNVPGTSVGCSW